MKNDTNCYDLVEIPKKLKLVLNERNFYKVENDQLSYFTYNFSTNLEQDFLQFALHYGESKGEKPTEYDFLDTDNLLEIIQFLDAKRKEYPYFLKPHYLLELSLKSYIGIEEFISRFGFSVEKHLYFRWNDEFKSNGIAELKQNWIRIDRENNQVLAKLEVHDLERFEEVWKKSDLKNDFLCKLNINRIKN